MGFTLGSNNDLAVFLGDGQNGFDVYPGVTNGHVTRMSTLGELTGDNYLDYACNWWDGVRIYRGTEGADFFDHLWIQMQDSALTVMCSDYNSDGHDDLAIGTSNSLEIHLAGRRAVEL